MARQAFSATGVSVTTEWTTLDTVALSTSFTSPMVHFEVQNTGTVRIAQFRIQLRSHSSGNWFQYVCALDMAADGKAGAIRSECCGVNAEAAFLQPPLPPLLGGVFPGNGSAVKFIRSEPADHPPGVGPNESIVYIIDLPSIGEMRVQARTDQSTTTAAIYGYLATESPTSGIGDLLADGSVPLVADWDNTGQRIRNTGVAEVQAAAPLTPATGVVWLDTDATGAAGTGLLNVNEFNSAITLTSSHTVALCDASGAAFTVTLPDVASNTNRRFFIKKIDSSANPVTVAANAIDGVPTRILASQNDAIMVVADGVEYWIL